MNGMNEKHDLIPLEYIASSILVIRGEKVMLDADLAMLYDVPTKALNQAVKRNLKRFPADFMFQLTREEVETLNRSQFVTGSQKHRDPRYPPYAFTEHGVAMLSSVLNSERAIEVNILIMRAFGRLREMVASHKDLARQLMEPPKSKNGLLGFVPLSNCTFVIEYATPTRQYGLCICGTAAPYIFTWDFINHV